MQRDRVVACIINLSHFPLTSLISRKLDAGSKNTKLIKIFNHAHCSVTVSVLNDISLLTLYIMFILFMKFVSSQTNNCEAPFEKR